MRDAASFWIDCVRPNLVQVSTIYCVVKQYNGINNKIGRIKGNKSTENLFFFRIHQKLAILTTHSEFLTFRRTSRPTCTKSTVH